MMKVEKNVEQFYQRVHSCLYDFPVALTDFSLYSQDIPYYTY